MKKLIWLILFFSPLAQAAWTPPIGIPMPPFGVNEVAPVYDPINPSHFYVDNSGTCSTTGNGTPTVPRCSIPTALVAGTYVEVHGGPYTSGVDVIWTASGTAVAPVFVKGVGLPLMQLKELFIHGSYIVVEGFDFSFQVRNRGRVNLENGDHQVLRDSRIHHSNSNHMVRTADITDAVILRNEVDHNGVLGRDLSGIGPAPGTDRLWIVDNHIHDIWNDGILFCHVCTNAPRNIYIGRNDIHTNGENAIDIKITTGPVVISQNKIHDQRNLAVSGGGPAIRLNDEGAQGPIWVIFNEIFDSINGINSQGSGAISYIYGNLFHEIDGYALNTGSLYAINNTTYSTGSVTAVNKLNNLELSLNSAGVNVVNAPAGDFHLIGISTAVDAGVDIPPAVSAAFQTDVGIPFPLVDFDGVVRPQGLGIDLGAFEFGGTPPPPPPPPPAQCADGLDNDADGLIDLADPGCVDAADNDETDPLPPPDTTPPVVLINTPAGTVDVNSVTLSGTANDNVGIVQVGWSNDTTAVSGLVVGLETWTVDIGLQVGPNVLTITATDAAGNSASASVTITFTPPNCTCSPAPCTCTAICGP